MLFDDPPQVHIGICPSALWPNAAAFSH